MRWLAHIVSSPATLSLSFPSKVRLLVCFFFTALAENFLEILFALLLRLTYTADTTSYFAVLITEVAA